MGVCEHYHVWIVYADGRGRLRSAAMRGRWSGPSGRFAARAWAEREMARYRRACPDKPPRRYFVKKCGWPEQCEVGPVRRVVEADRETWPEYRRAS